MRLIKMLGVVLLLAGSLIVVSSSGAFDSLDADRGVTVKTAADENAYLGVKYDDKLTTSTDGTPTLELESGKADGGGFCIFDCYDYEYNDMEIIIFEDNTATGGLSIADESFATDNGDVAARNDLRIKNDQGIGVMRGDFNCPADRRGLFEFYQEEASTKTTVSIQASDGDVTINLKREVNIECVPD
ncbi:hypothetical protein [Natrinema hispanicum]|uniref:Uncharacterized protein n=1 Tax=Natrinema hispanicum TaxID=392421 RepID=A0A1G6KVG9_9EURY|nr:hypothetical protein [Natrinema hispanicum]SDC34974.1 hypothetical protein SAMN05192552_100393 [Natrinema hispanicum]